MKKLIYFIFCGCLNLNNQDDPDATLKSVTDASVDSASNTYDTGASVDSASNTYDVEYKSFELLTCSGSLIDTNTK